MSPRVCWFLVLVVLAALAFCIWQHSTTRRELEECRAALQAGAPVPVFSPPAPPGPIIITDPDPQPNGMHFGFDGYGQQANYPHCIQNPGDFINESAVGAVDQFKWQLNGQEVQLTKFQADFKFNGVVKRLIIRRTSENRLSWELGGVTLMAHHYDNPNDWHEHLCGELVPGSMKFVKSGQTQELPVSSGQVHLRKQ